MRVHVMSGWFGLAILLSASGLWAQGAVPTQPATTATQPATTQPVRMLRFEDTPADAVIEQLANRVGLVIEKSGPIPGRISAYVPEPLSVDQAASLIDSLLLSVHYAAIERPGADGQRILRIMTFDQAKKQASISER